MMKKALSALTITLLAGIFVFMQGCGGESTNENNQTDLNDPNNIKTVDYTSKAFNLYLIAGEELEPFVNYIKAKNNNELKLGEDELIYIKTDNLFNAVETLKSTQLKTDGNRRNVIFWVFRPNDFKDLDANKMAADNLLSYTMENDLILIAGNSYYLPQDKTDDNLIKTHNDYDDYLRSLYAKYTDKIYIFDFARILGLNGYLNPSYYDSASVSLINDEGNKALDSELALYLDTLHIHLRDIENKQ